MCGICGIYNFQGNKVDDETLRRMNTRLNHRGPDEEGFFIDNNVGLGHKRLSIIDLREGQQPMTLNGEGFKITLTFNGEIYNYLELREELEKEGLKFATHSDTEVILKSYVKWGPKCVEKFNGMWAFALWDERRKILFLSRDRLGEKPLYYSVVKNTLLFASEIKSLVEYGLKVEPNTEMIKLLLLLQYVPAPNTFFKHVKLLEPGHNLVVENGLISKRKYWDLPLISNGDLETNAEKVYEEFEALFFDSVKLRTRSDVSFGAFLSGGLDSSSIVAAMSLINDYPVETFSIGFKEKQFDETDLADLVAKKYKTNHHVSTVDQSAYSDYLEKVLLSYDDPFGDSSAIPTGKVSELAVRKVKMVLVGDGGDEVLSGYTTYQGEKFAAMYKTWPEWIRKAVPNFIELISLPLRGGLKYKSNRISGILTFSNLDFVERLSYKAGQIDPKYLFSLLQNKESMISFPEFYHGAFDYLAKDLDNFYKLMYWNLKCSLPNDMLTKVDRMSMAHSLETRMPFLDYRIVELMVKVHKDIKMKDFERKSVLRRTVAKNLPKELLSAKKMGFGVPVREWFKADRLIGELEELGSLHEYIDSTKWRRLLHYNKTGKVDLGNFIWTVAVLKMWYKKYGIL